MAEKNKNVKALVVYDDVGYQTGEDASGNPTYAYASRGDEIELTPEDWERHGERSQEELERGNFPAVVKPDHPHRDYLVGGVEPAANPDLEFVKMKAAHGITTSPLLTPAMQPASEVSTTRAPTRVGDGGLQIDFGSLDKGTLQKLAKAAGIDSGDMKKDELVAALQGASADAGVTPRLGSVPASEESETGGESAGETS